MELIERVKKIGDQIMKLEAAYKVAEGYLLEAVDHLGIHSITKMDGEYRVSVKTVEDLEELANGKKLKVDDFNSDIYPFRASFKEHGVEFFILLSETEYMKHFAPTENNDDETEYARARMTEEKRKMREAGHRESDFR